MAQGQSDEDPLIGQVLNGRFRVLGRIGAGGMGRVYKAVQEPIDRIVALKVLSPRYDGNKDPGFERRFFLEASMTAKLKHPNTITVHDYGRTDDGTYYIAMEYLEGETLQSVLRRGPLPWPRALSIASQIARSLREAHKLGMVHRDLKPANVMLLGEGTGGDTVKVLDFGLVKSFQVDKVDGDADDEESITQAGVLLGSPLYMAPEQAKGEADGRTDIYALGTLLFQCIAGRTPFQGRESINILVKQVREAPPKLSSLVASLPTEVNDLVMRCLAKSPSARFQSMDELLDEIRILLGGQGLSSTFADPRPSASRLNTAPSHLVVPPSDSSVSLEVQVDESRPSRAPMVVAIVIVALGVFAGAAVFFRQRQAAAKPTPVTPVAKPAQKVVFTIDSEPQGASVFRDGALEGKTPFSLTVERTAEEMARVKLWFELEGYEDTTVVAQGAQGVVPVKPVLKKNEPVVDDAALVPIPKGPPKKNTKPPGYKDDPYQ